MSKAIDQTAPVNLRILDEWKKILVVASLLFSNSANADFLLEAGPTYLSEELSDGWSFVINNRITPKWDIGIGYVSEQMVLPSWEEDRGLPETYVDKNYFLHGQRIFSFKKIELGIGIAYFQNTNRALGRDVVSSLSLGWNFNDAFSIRVRHFSNAGSASPNMGQDIISLGVTF